MRSLGKQMLVLLLVTAIAGGVTTVSLGQTGKDTETCDRQFALALVQQQAVEAKSLDDISAGISIMINAADLLWDSRPAAARSIFTEAYDRALQNFQQKENPELKTKPRAKDQRFEVIRAIARHDYEWAQRLVKQVLADAEAASDREGNTQNSTPQQQLLRLAGSLISDNPEIALNYARASLRYPAQEDLARFLYLLAGSNQRAADQFYTEALRVYANATMTELLYLSAYPFASNRPAGPGAQSTYLPVPANFLPSSVVQQQFLTVLLGRIDKFLETPVRAVDGPYGLPIPAQIYLALLALEPMVAQAQPSFLGPAREAKSTVWSMLPSDLQSQTTSIWQGQQQIDNAFEDLTEKAKLERDPARKDQYIAKAVLAASDKETLDRVQGLIDQVSETQVRDELVDWLYFKRAQKAIADGNVDQAIKLSKRVEKLDHRAYLLLEVATEIIKQKQDESVAREALDQVVSTASKADDTVEKARVLLGAAYSYAQFDTFRSREAANSAIKIINKLPQPNLENTTLVRRINGKLFTVFAAYKMPGFSLANVFNKLSSEGIDNAVGVANTLENKSLRTTATLAW